MSPEEKREMVFRIVWFTSTLMLVLGYIIFLWIMLKG